MADFDHAKHEHTPTQPNPRREFLKKDIGGDFKEDVRDEEHRKCSIILISNQFQIFDQREGFRVGDIDTVEEREEVQDAEEGDYVEIDLGHEFLLGGVRWAGDVQVVVFDILVIADEVWVVEIVGFVFETALVVYGRCRRLGRSCW